MTQRTGYRIEAGSTQLLELHHRRLLGHTVKPLPPGTVELADRLIVSRDVTAGGVTRVDIDEHQPHRLNRPLDRIPATELRVYLDGSKLPPDVEDRLPGALAHLQAIETHRLALAADRVKLAAAVSRWQHSRRPLDRATRTELEDIGRSIGLTTELLERERARLDELIAKLPTW